MHKPIQDIANYFHLCCLLHMGAPIKWLMRRFRRKGSLQIQCLHRRGMGSWKSGHSKEGCVNFIQQVSSLCGQGEGVKKSKKFAYVIYGRSQMGCASLNSDKEKKISRNTNCVCRCCRKFSRNSNRIVS